MKSCACYCSSLWTTWRNLKQRHEHDLSARNADLISYPDLVSYQKDAYYVGSHHLILLSSVKRLNYDMKVFKPALEDYLSSHTYSVEEFASSENYYRYKHLCK